jgi:hypothetical protein
VVACVRRALSSIWNSIYRESRLRTIVVRRELSAVFYIVLHRFKIKPLENMRDGGSGGAIDIAVLRAFIA